MQMYRRDYMVQVYGRESMVQMYRRDYLVQVYGREVHGADVQAEACGVRKWA